MKFLTFLTATFLAAQASAAVRAEKKETRTLFNTTPVIAAGDIQVACTNTTTDTPGCKCAAVSTRGFSKVWLTVIYTKSAATRLDLEVHTANVANAWGTLQSGPQDLLPSLLMADHDPYWNTSGLSGLNGWSTGFDVVAPSMRFCFVGTAADASDLIDVYISRF